MQVDIQATDRPIYRENRSVFVRKALKQQLFAQTWFMGQMEEGRSPRGGVMMSKHMMTVLTWVLSLLSGAMSVMFVLWLEAIAG